MAKVLVIRTSSFGDVAMLVPVVYSVAARYPQDRFLIMTRKAFSPLFENLGFNISVIPLDMNKRHRGIRGMYRILQRCLTNGITHVADEHDVLRSKVIRFFMRATGRKVAYIDKGRQEKTDLIQCKRVEYPLKPTVVRYLDVFAKLGFSAEIVFNNIFDFIPREFSSLSQIIGEKTGKWIGIAPFSKHRGKIYPLTKMERVVEMLSARAHTTVFLFGAGKEEEQVLAYWSQKYTNVVNLANKVKLEKELLLISYLDVMLSMDSANMHLASLAQIPVVSIWGATHPSMGFYGFGQDPSNAIQIDLHCRPCSVYGDLPCERGDYACMERIAPEVVVERISKILDK